MRKDILLPALVLAGGGLGAGLRRWQLTTGYDPQTFLFSPGHPAAWAIPLVTAAVVLALLVLLRRAKGLTDFSSAFRCPHSAYMAGMAASGLLLLLAGVLGLLEGMEQLSLWRAAPDAHLLTYPISLLLCALLCFLAGPAQLLVGRGAYRSCPVENASLLAVFPPMAALVWLFSFHLDHGTDPILMGYGYSLAAVIFLMLAQYEQAAFFHQRPHPRRALFFALMGTYFAVISLADLPTLFFAALTTAFTLSALSGACALLRNIFGPPWPKRLLDERMPRGAQPEHADQD